MTDMQDNQAIQLKRIADVLWLFYKKQYPEDMKEPPLVRVPLGEYQKSLHQALGLRGMKMDIQQFAFRVSERTDDVVARVLTLTIPDEVEVPDGFPRVQVRTIEGAAAGQSDGDLSPDRDIATVGAFEVPEGANYTLSTVAMDNAGNQSVPTVQDLNAADEISPSSEGVLERLPLAERSVEDPTS